MGRSPLPYQHSRRSSYDDYHRRRPVDNYHLDKRGGGDRSARDRSARDYDARVDRGIDSRGYRGFESKSYSDARSSSDRKHVGQDESSRSRGSHVVKRNLNPDLETPIKKNENKVVPSAPTKKDEKEKKVHGKDDKTNKGSGKEVVKGTEADEEKIKKLQKLCEDQKQELEEKKKENRELRKKSVTRNRTLEILADMNKNNNALKEKVLNLEETIEKEKVDHEIKMETMQQEIGTLKDGRKEVAQELENVKQEPAIASLKKNINRIRDERDAWKVKTEEKERLIAGYEVEKEALEKKLDECESDLNETKKKLKNTEQKLKKFGKYLHKVNDRTGSENDDDEEYEGSEEDFEEEGTSEGKGNETIDSKGEVKEDCIEDGDSIPDNDREQGNHDAGSKTDVSLETEPPSQTTVDLDDITDTKGRRGDFEEKDVVEGSSGDDFVNNIKPDKMVKKGKSEGKKKKKSLTSALFNDESDEELMVDSSNDEEMAKKRNEINSETFFLDSEEEFADEQFDVGRTIVSNFKKDKVKETLASGVKVPVGLFEKDSKFKAVPVSLNNKLVFIATSSNEGSHSGDKRICSLTPACNIFWNTGAKISLVKILACDLKEVPVKEMWACSHHSRASVQGYGLQTQRYRHLPKVVVNIEDVGGGEKKEMVDAREGGSKDGIIQEVEGKKVDLKMDTDTQDLAMELTSSCGRNRKRVGFVEEDKQNKRRKGERKSLSKTKKKVNDEGVEKLFNKYGDEGDDLKK
jgi:hypothetical protein